MNQKNLHALHFFIAAGLTAIYCFLILKYYTTSFYAPDFLLYGTFGDAKLPARDGFSSLFINTAALVRYSPHLLIAASLAMMLTAMFVMLYTTLRLNRGLAEGALGIGIIFSAGIWYYVSGKLYYDFPFTIFSYAICFFILYKIHEADDGKTTKFLCALFFMCGFCLSWKPYNVFALAGILTASISDQSIRKKIFPKIFGTRTFFMLVALFICGYVTGNYRILTETALSVKGILAYPAHSLLRQFLLGPPFKVWDHVGNEPFNRSTMLVASGTLILFLLPLICKRWAELFLSIIFTSLFLIFISHFSPGYAWHGFTFGLYIITVFVYGQRAASGIALWRRNMARTLCLVAGSMQIWSNFHFYLPLQNSWFESTHSSIDVTQNDSARIAAAIKELVRDVKTTYVVDPGIERFCFVETKQNGIFSNEQPFVPCIFDKNDVWKSFYFDSRYRPNIFNSNYPDYLVVVTLTSFLPLSSILQSREFPSWWVKISETEGNGYHLTLFHRSMSSTH